MFGAAPSPATMAGSSTGRRANRPVEVHEPEDLLVGAGSDILIVDDDATNLVAYEAALEPLGRRLVAVPSGVSALGKLLDQDFALMLLDVSMPEMSGIETARRIRERPRSRGLPIIFITGAMSSTGVILEAYDVGACDFVVKPILPEVLRAKARVYLQLQERTHEVLRNATKLREAQRLLDEADEKIRQRDAAAATARKLEALQQATAALSQARTPDEVADVVVRLGSAAVNASGATMWVSRGDGSLAIAGSHGVPDEYLDAFRVISPETPWPIWKVLHGREMWVENAEDYAREAPEVVDKAFAANRVNAFAALPLMATGRGEGVVVFSFQRNHTFTEQQRKFLSALVRASEQALERARLYVREAEARRAAELASQRKDEFLAMLSHELRNPLWTIVNAVHLMKTRPPTGQDIQLVERQSNHLKHMVDDLLDASRITHGKVTLRREVVDLTDAVTATLEAVNPLIARDDHDVRVNVPGGLLLDGDPHRVRQVLGNLITNAAKYTRPRGRIEISGSEEGDFVRIAVRDNGQGIAPALLPTLFELFVQGERTLDRSEGGLGIGLTLVKTVVELHGGRVEAHSDGPGTGATFVMHWPKATPHTPAAKPPALRSAVPAAGKRVLIVDDNVEAAQVLAAVLDTLGYAVDVAHDGLAAIASVERLAPDVALLDIGLPTMDGYELVGRLRRIPACASTLFVAVTGYGHATDIERSQAAGFAHHLVKPVELSALEALLASHPGT